MTSFQSTQTGGVTSMFFEPSDEHPLTISQKRPRGVGVQGNGVHLSHVENQRDNPSRSNQMIEKEKARFRNAMQRSQYRPYAAKCNCPTSCTCGCQEGKGCKCSMRHDGQMKCPAPPNTRPQSATTRRPTMQSSRLPHESAITAFGKDRQVEHRQDYTKFSQIMANRTQDHGAYPTLPQESNRGRGGSQEACPHCRRNY